MCPAFAFAFTGTRAWSLNIRDSKGVRRRFEVGSGLSLAEARRKAEDLRRNIRGGAKLLSGEPRDNEHWLQKAVSAL